jgi:phosphatidylethanolamine-binding protein (PEBP) family uncharacterized protein
MRASSIAAATLLIAAAALTSPHSASAFSAKFSWQGIPPCSTTSPAFAVSGAPRGTAALAFTMRDRDAPDFQHGGSTVPYAGVGKVSKGSITYVGPCPPPGASHRYLWTVDALGRDGAALGSTTAEGRFPR